MHNLSKLVILVPVLVLVLFATVLPFANESRAAWNDPYPASDAKENILYSAFSERPKFLDPARAYSEDEYAFITQIYEPPLQYHYLKRPYRLIPLTTTRMPRVRYFDAMGNEISSTDTVTEAVISEYEFSIKPGIMYQPHPAFATGETGEFLYHVLDQEQLEQIYDIGDFSNTGTRELIADDYVYQIKRMADPARQCPIASVMAQYIEGFSDLSESLNTHRETATDTFVDLRELKLDGVEVKDRYTYVIRIRGKYPQFLYWQAMPFFAPMPWEADRFYTQPELEQRNITLNWYPVGTGAFMLEENNPNLRMVMKRNPNFHGETYPSEGDAEDGPQGLLADAGKPMPFIERAVYSLEKESIPRWNKFLQGYFDNSGISSDSFDQAVQFSSQGEASVTDEMAAMGIKLSTAVETTIIYMGFNMLDPVVGGYDERGRKLRQAISIAVDFEEFVSIFRNGRGVPAQGPIPPGIFGVRSDEKGVNPYVYEWVDGKAVRKSIDAAHRLLREAGYVDGIDPVTNKPLAINFEAVARGPDDKARLNWLRRQFKKIGIELIIRATDYNRFREKMLTGKSQVYMWGWNADYPDPENFLFLLYGPNAKATFQGENTSNYQNPEFDRLFEQMKNMENSGQRQSIIDKMIRISQRDAPWAWGLYPKDFSLYHAWYGNAKPMLMVRNTLKYKRVDAAKRAALREQWNTPVLWPLWALGALFAISVIPAVITFRRHEKSSAL